MRQGRRRRDGQLSPARRHRHLRRAGAHGAGLLAALSARRRAGQLRLARRRRGRVDALHRVQAAEDRGRADRRDPLEDGRVAPELRRHALRAGGAAVEAAEPPGQRHAGHRRRHGHVDSAAQPRRGGRGVHRAGRRSEPRVEGSAQVHQGARLSDGRPGARVQARPQGDLRGRLGHAQAARRMGGRGAQGAQAAADRDHHVDSLRPDQAVDRREDRRDHPRAQAAADGRRARSVDHRRAHRDRDQEGRRSRADHGVPVQEHRAADQRAGQPDLPRADGEPRGRPPRAAQPQGLPAPLPRLPLRGGHAPLPLRSRRAQPAHPHPRGLRQGLRRARRGHPHHPQVRGQAGRGAEADEAVRARRGAGRRHPRAQALSPGAPRDPR